MSFSGNQQQKCISRQLLSIIFSLMLLLSTGCASLPDQTNTSHTSSSVQKPSSGKQATGSQILNVGSYINYPPQEFIEAKSETIIGFDIDLMQSLAQYMHVQAKIINTDYPVMIHSLTLGYVDVVISAIPITAENQAQASFIPYFRGGESLLVNKGNVAHLESTDDLCGLPIGVGDGTVEQNDLRIAGIDCQQHNERSPTIIVVSSQQQAIQLLATKKIAALYQDSAMSDYDMLMYANQFELAGPIVNIVLEGIAVRKNDMQLFHVLQSAFRALSTNGTYHRLIVKWGLKNEEI